MQHQIFENLKEVLPRRYQHTMGLVDKQMTEALRHRMLAAMGGNEYDIPLLDKCLDVVEQLKLQADYITGELRETLDEQKKKLDEQNREAALADPLVHIESEDTDIDAE